LFLAGRTQREIASELGVSQPAVKKMLARTAADLDADLRRYTRVHIIRLMAQHDELYVEQRAAWERSKGEKTRRRHRRIFGGGSPAEGARTVTEAEATSREGDPRFAALMLQILKEKRTYLERFVGPVSPPAQTPSDPYEHTSKQLQRLSADELRQLAEFSEARLMYPQLSQDVTPEQLERWATLKRSLKRLDDEPDRG
jgi:hypothetical protein